MLNLPTQSNDKWTNATNCLQGVGIAPKCGKKSATTPQKFLLCLASSILTGIGELAHKR